MTHKRFNLKFTKTERSYWLSELQNNRRFFILMYLLLGCIQCLLLLAMYISPATTLIPTIDKSYLPYYMTGICISFLSAAAIGWQKTKTRFLQIFCLFIIMIWACVFSVHDLALGYSSYVLAQVLIITAAAIRFPVRIHFSIHTFTFLLFVILMLPLDMEPDLKLTYMINTGILFFLSSFFITFINQTRYENFRNTIIMQQQRNQLLHMTQYDALTDLYSRSMILEMLEDAFKKEECVGCIMTDIDNFKSYNDQHGHRTGDNVLKHAALLVQQVVSAVDGKAGRYGGEEFLILLKDCDEKKLNTVLQKLQAAFQDSKEEHAVTLSMGGTLLLKEDTPDTLISRADQAMYCAKRAGKHTFRIL